MNRPVALCIAGLDPSGGAGLLADIKTFEQHQVYGLAVSTAQTLQTEDSFRTLRWEKQQDVLEAVQLMLEHYPVQAVKIGITENLKVLHDIVALVRAVRPEAKIVVDPVIKSTTAFVFWQEEEDQELLKEALRHLDLLTPNYQEASQLAPFADGHQAAQALSAYCNVLLKGGHNPAEPGTDYLFTAAGVERLKASGKSVFPKHGSGCILSAAIAANLAKGDELLAACAKAKEYVEKVLGSTDHLLGYHHV